MRYNYRRISITAVSLLMFLLPLALASYTLLEQLIKIRISSAILDFTMSVAVALWFFWLGLRVNEKHKNRNSIVLISFAVVGFMFYVGSLLIGRFRLFMPLYENMWPYFAEMLAYRIPVLLYGLVFMVLGMFLRGKEIKLSGRKAWAYCVSSALLYLGCCIVAEYVYDGIDEYHIWHALVNAVSVFPLIGLMLSIYDLSGRDSKECRYHGMIGFSEYLCPSAIFVYVLKIYASPILVLLYIVVMWFIYKKFR